MNCSIRKRDNDDGGVQSEEMDEEVEFKPFHMTYKIISFTMSVGMIYPNPRTDMWRLASIPLLILSGTPLVVMILIDMYYCWMDRDIVNVIRHSTVLGPFLAGFFKMLLMYYKRVQAKEILDEIDRDYLMYNQYSKEYKQIAREGIKNSVIYSERCWSITVLFCVMTFPVMAIVLTIYNFTFKFEATKYMIHDLNKPFSELDARFESPYFEVMFVYMLYVSCLYVLSFIGYDGFFGLSINHACMKMDLYCKALENAFKDGVNVHGLVVQVINEQCRMYQFVITIQDTFNIWLGLIFIATMIQICTCLYHVIEGHGFDLRYMVFAAASVIHIYAPCRYAAKLKSMSLATSDRVYCSGWENSMTHDTRVVRMLPLMIARAQIPSQISAFDMIAFDMELFLSILQTSYSMFTLLRS